MLLYFYTLHVLIMFTIRASQSEAIFEVLPALDLHSPRTSGVIVV